MSECIKCKKTKVNNSEQKQTKTRMEDMTLCHNSMNLF